MVILPIKVFFSQLVRSCTCAVTGYCKLQLLQQLTMCIQWIAEHVAKRGIQISGRVQIDHVCATVTSHLHKTSICFIVSRGRY